jgi:succinoglycan biosynthesis transport protein ExoP
MTRTGTSGGAPRKSENPFGLHSPQEFLEVPLRRPLFVFVPAVMVLVAAITLSFVLPKKYRSSTLILVESEKVPDSFVPKIATETMARRLDTIQQEVLSRTRLERVIEDTKPYTPASGGRLPSLSSQVETMRAATSVQMKGADAFLIAFVHENPVKAAEVANRLAALFIEETEGARARQASEGFQFIDSQLLAARKDLELKEQAVREFKERNLGTLPEQTSTNLATLQRLQLEQQSVAESLSAAQGRLAQLRQSVQQAPRGARAGGGASDPPAEIAQLRAQLATLRARYTPRHPDVLALEQRLRELEAAQAAARVEDAAAVDPEPSSVSDQLKRAELEIEELQARRARIDQQMARVQGRVDSSPRTEQDLATLTRDLTQIRESYLALLKKRMEAQMAVQMEQRWQGERFKVLDPANVPEEAVFPNRLRFALGGLLAGLIAGVAAAFAREWLDHSVKSLDDLEGVVPVPLMAAIPLIDSAQPSPRPTR